MSIKRYFHIIRLFLLRDGFKRAQYLKKHRIFKSMGDDCFYYPYIYTPEANLVSLGSNVVIASGVKLITHDMSYTLLSHDPQLKENGKKYPYYTCGIKIASNVMIGANAIIMPGVDIGNHVVVGGGAVVASHIPDGVVVVGCPAKIIGTYEKFAEKRGVDSGK